MGDPALLLLARCEDIYDTFPQPKDRGNWRFPGLVYPHYRPSWSSFRINCNCSTVLLTVRTALITLDG
jgi:hypothetical protein